MNKKNRQQKNWKFFLQEFIQHPYQVASLIPSSRFLERRIVDIANVKTARTILELGPGTGGTTRAILRAMPTQARLIAIEINPNFHNLVKSITDDRLIVHLGNAVKLENIMTQYNLNSPDIVISGIPFSTIDNTSGNQIIESISSVLAANGRFVAYQVRNSVNKLCSPLMGSAKIEVELLNFPPIRIYRWEKNGLH